MAITAKKWIAIFLASLGAMVLIFSLLVYWIDPFMQYKYTDGLFFLSPTFINAGIAKNYDYDAAVIGSSVAQNFDMDYFRGEMRRRPVKLALSGMSVNEILHMYDLVQKRTGVNTIYINIDWMHLNREYRVGAPSDRWPPYLYNDNKLDDIKYFLGYEVWFRYLPMNAAVHVLRRANVTLPGTLHDKLNDRLNIDKLGDWSSEALFSKVVVMNDYQTPSVAMLEKDVVAMRGTMKNNMEILLSHIIKTKKEGQAVVFGFPPYSALYWYTQRETGALDPIMDAKLFFLQRCAHVDNIRVGDLQDIPEITNLDHL